MTYRLLVLALALLAADDLGAQARRVYVPLRGHAQLILLDTLVDWQDVLAPPAQTYSAAKRIVDSLKLPIPVADSARGLLHSPFFVARNTLAGHLRSWVVRCGIGISGDYADSWRLSITYVVFVDPTADGNSRLGVAFFGGVDPIEGASKPSIPCSTTGKLETFVANAVQLRIARASP